MRALVRQIIRIACAPQAEWPRIAGAREPARLAAHALLVALVPAAAAALAAASPAAGVRVAAAFALGMALAAAAFWLAARLHARRASFTAAFKLSAYGATPLAAAAALGVLPHLELLPLIGLVHALYLVDAGAPALLGVPHESSAQLTVVAAVLAALALWLLSAAGGAAGLL